MTLMKLRMLLCITLTILLMSNVLSYAYKEDLASISPRTHNGMFIEASNAYNGGHFKPESTTSGTLTQSYGYRLMVGGIPRLRLYTIYLTSGRHSLTLSLIGDDQVDDPGALIYDPNGEYLTQKASFDGLSFSFTTDKTGYHFIIIYCADDDNYDYMMDYGLVIKAAAKDLDPTAYLHYKDWFKYPMAAILPFKGCIFNCVTCGGSGFAYKNICGRVKPALKKPETLFEEIKIISEYIKCAIFILNDLRVCGEKYVEKLGRQEK